MVVNDLDEMRASVAEAAYDLQRLVKERVQVNAYATWGQTSGFDPHWDDHDVVVLQIEGTKHWDVFGPSTRFPVDHRLHPENQRPQETVWSGELGPGEGLYLPRGWWHAVRGVGEVSLHLTFGFQRRTGLHYVQWLTTTLPRMEAFRRDLKRFEGTSEELSRSLADAAAVADVSNFLAAFEEALERPRMLDLGAICPAPSTDTW